MSWLFDNINSRGLDPTEGVNQTLTVERQSLGRWVDALDSSMEETMLEFFCRAGNHLNLLVQHYWPWVNFRCWRQSCKDSTVVTKKALAYGLFTEYLTQTVFRNALRHSEAARYIFQLGGAAVDDAAWWQQESYYDEALHNPVVPMDFSLPSPVPEESSSAGNSTAAEGTQTTPNLQQTQHRQGEPSVVVQAPVPRKISDDRSSVPLESKSSTPSLSPPPADESSDDEDEAWVPGNALDEGQSDSEYHPGATPSLYSSHRSTPTPTPTRNPTASPPPTGTANHTRTHRPTPVATPALTPTLAAKLPADTTLGVQGVPVQPVQPALPSVIPPIISALDEDRDLDDIVDSPNSSLPTSPQIAAVKSRFPDASPMIALPPIPPQASTTSTIHQKFRPAFLATNSDLPKICLHNLHSQTAAVHHLPGGLAFDEEKYEEAVAHALRFLPILGDARVWFLESLIDKVKAEMRAGPEAMFHSLGATVAAHKVCGIILEWLSI